MKTGNPPRPYDMRRPEEVKRWFREMRGYLRTSRFLEYGTDFDGRRYAMKGFDWLERREKASRIKRG